ncbi:hypothetical protein FACS1894217_09350 [Clostridia bacterium]|nr:hypothetical protein FACS1894217_09350 [Clostridia bacterium]
MNNEIIALIDVLEAQRDIYRGLITLSEQKKEAILAGKVNQLDRLVKDEQEPLTRLRELERRRKSELEKLAARLKIPAADIKLHDVLAVAPANIKNRLQTVQEELTTALKSQMTINEVVKKLLESRLEYISFMMDMNTGDYTNSYNAEAGENRPQKPVTRIIDLGV